MQSEETELEIDVEVVVPAPKTFLFKRVADDDLPPGYDPCSIDYIDVTDEIGNVGVWEKVRAKVIVDPANPAAYRLEVDLS